MQVKEIIEKYKWGWVNKTVDIVKKEIEEKMAEASISEYEIKTFPEGGLAGPGAIVGEISQIRLRTKQDNINIVRYVEVI